MKQMYQALLSVLIIGSLISCTSETKVSSTEEHDQGPFYVEFVSCTKGSDFSKSTLSNMMEDWRSLPISNELRGSYLYDPIEQENAFGPSMWWELEWSSKEAADEAWQAWSQNTAADNWAEEYQNVMMCDGVGRNAWDIVIPISSSTFGESNNSGYFYSQYWTCSYKNGAGKNDIKTFLPIHASKILSSNLEDTGYHYGVYFDRRSEEASHSEVQANLVWGEWAISKDAMEVQNQNFADNFQEVFEEFDKIGSCLDTPDAFDSWMLYSSSNQDYSPEF